MEHHEAEQMAKRILDESGYTDYSIKSNSHVVGTNVRTVQAVKDNLTITLTIDEASGKLIHKIESRSNQVDIHEQIPPITDSVSVQSILYFELHQKVLIGNNIKGNDKFQIITDPQDSRYVTGLRIEVSDTSDQTINKAIEEATRFTNYLTIITNIPVNHKRPRISIKKNGVSTNTVSYTIDAVLVKLQDLDVSKISNFLQKDSRLQQHLKRYHDGLEALQDNNFAEAIRNLFQIIENQNTTDSRKYLPLRHGVSHDELDKDNTINGLASFGIHIKKNEHVNLNDPKIQSILEREANNLQKIVWSYLQNEIQKIS